MKSSAFLINTARGGVVEQEALIAALKSHVIAGAALDVFHNEPWTGSFPEELKTLVNLKNVVATPHIGFNTEETKDRLGQELIENLIAIRRGSPVNVVN